MGVSDLPALNAGLNATSGLLLATGYAFIRAGRRKAHRNCMVGALVSSALFLTSYLVYHFQVGSVRVGVFGLDTDESVAIVPLVGTTVVRALRERFDAHRRIARITLPLWAYVSVTGVVIYWMLYRGR